MSFEEAEKEIMRYFKSEPLGTESVPLLECVGRVLGEDVKSLVDVPSFDRSVVDGYAVRASDTFGAEENRPVRLKVVGSVSIGELPKVVVRSETAVEIVTGAPIPKGSDAVVMLEHASRKGSQVQVHSAVVDGENVMKAGSDIRKGETVLRRGQRLGAREIGVLAAVGKVKALVFRVPRVAVLSTGGEIAEPEKKLPAGKIYDINAYSLSGAVVESGGKPVYLGVFPDDAHELRKALLKALSLADVVVSSGGVSVGPKDLTPKTLDLFGKPGVIVSGVAVKPGKPTTVAVVDGKPVFALPGHPTSALLMFYLLVRPIVRRMAGVEDVDLAEAEAVAGMRMFPAKGRRTYVMVRLVEDEAGRVVAEPVEFGQSGAIATLAKADGFVLVPENVQFVDAGEKVTVHLFGKCLG